MKKVLANPLFIAMVNSSSKAVDSKMAISVLESSTKKEVSKDILRKATAQMLRKDAYSYTDDMKRLRSYCEVLKAKNSGVHYDLKDDADGDLEYFAIVLPGRKAEFKNYRKIFGVDATHFKDILVNLTAEEKEAFDFDDNDLVFLANRVVVALTGRDINNRNIIIALVVAPSENITAVKMLFDVCQSVDIDLNNQYHTFIYDWFYMFIFFIYYFNFINVIY
jgi:hypothetical protein